MMRGMPLLVIVTSMLLGTTNGLAATPQTELPSRHVESSNSELLRSAQQSNPKVLMQEYEARIAEYESGRMPASVVLRANRKLLYASLMTDASNAALEYDRRASEIEAFAIRNLELGTATQQDVAQAKSARLDAMLKGLLIDNDSRRN